MSTATRLEASNDEKLPDGWQRAKVADICKFIDYGYTASANFSVDTPKFLRITDIQNGCVDWEAVPGCEITAEDEETNKLRDGDIVFARTGGTTGKSFLIRQPPRAVFASYLIRLRPHERVTSDFIYAFFQSNDYWQQVNAHARGGAQPNVNATLLGSMTLPLPPLAEQKRIAGILKEQLAAVERARAAAEAQLEAAKALPAAYLRSRFDTPEAEAWDCRRIGDFAKTCSGSTPSRSHPEYFDGDIPWVKTAELRDGEIVDTEEHVSKAAVGETSLRLLPPNTLLVAMYGQGQTRGRTGRLMYEATTNQACFAILPNDSEFDTAYRQC